MSTATWSPLLQSGLDACPSRVDAVRHLRLLDALALAMPLDMEIVRLRSEIVAAQGAVFAGLAR